MNIIKTKLAFVLFLLSSTLFSQNTITFTIVDSLTNEPIAFANILFDNSTSSGTISDINGRVIIENKTVKTITISYVGYETLTLKLKDLKNTKIKLKTKIDELNEIILNSKENPAHRIIRNVIKNKTLNNPKNISSYTYTSYNKVIFDSDSDSKNDTINKNLSDFLKDKYFFISETISNHKYLSPNLSEDSIVATKTSGFKHPSFALLTTSFQPFSFYENYINLYDINYLNPISKGSLKKYKFKLENEFIQGKDTVFIISFMPKKNKNFDALKGLLYINSNKYAVQNVDATPNIKGKIAIKIQQKHNFIDEKYWFPEQLNFEIILGKDPFAMKYTGEAYITNIKTDVQQSKKDFSFEALVFSKEATKKDSIFWSTFRTNPLDLKEQRTYQFIDSIGKKYHFDTILKYGESLVTGKLPLFKYVDLDLKQIASANKHEGLRLGVGLYTNDDLIKNVSFGGFFGYGFDDHKWKYGAEIITKIPSKKDISIAVKYESNLKEVGLNNINKKSFNLRSLLAEKMDKIEAYSIRSDMKLFRNFYWSFQFNHTDVSPQYDYSYISNNTIIRSYLNSEFNVNLRYHVGETVINSFNTKISVKSDNPVLSLTYSRGLKNLFKSEFSYNKFEFSLDHTFKLLNFGKTTYRFEAAYIDSSLPYGLLITGEGGLDSDYPLVVENSFQTLRPYEFLSDANVNLFTWHNFGGLLFKMGNFQPDIILHNNIGYGSLSQSFRHQNISFITKNKVFLETGLEFRNILKLNYLNIGSIGFGFGTFYRYGAYSFPKFEDNLEFKFGMSFTFK